MTSGQPGFENHQLAANLSCAPFLQKVRQTQNAARVFGRQAFKAATVHWPAVRDGDSEAMRLLADWIRNGVGQNGCNLHDSVALYRAASELGNEGASIYLDLLTQNGPQGISADMEKAYLIFTHFPGRGQVVALFKLGRIFHTRWEKATEQLSQTPGNAAAAKSMSNQDQTKYSECHDVFQKNY